MRDLGLLLKFRLAFSVVISAVAGYLLQHVLEERQAGLDGELAAAIKVHTDLDAGFVGVALNTGLTR